MASEHIRFVHGNKEDFEAGKAKHLVPGCINNGVPEAVAEEIWSKMTKFAEYAFNRSHAACYAYIAYITAYMACHWPEEFFAAMLNAFIENSDKMKSYLGHAAKRGIRLEIPDVQRSYCKFKAENNAILYGLQGITGLKSQAVDIVADRDENGLYLNLQNLYERMGKRGNLLDKTSIEGLIYSGALNSFSENKAALLEQAELVKKSYKSHAGDFALGQISLFGEQDNAVTMPKTTPFSWEYALEKEREVLGMYVSSHPTDKYVDKLRFVSDITPLENLAQSKQIAKGVQTMVMIRDLKPFLSKKGQSMAAFKLETKFATISCVIFPKEYEKCQENLLPNAVVCITGDWNKDNRDETAMQMIVTDVSKADFLLRAQVSEKPVAPVKKKPEEVRVYITSKEEQQEVLAFIKANVGPTPVIFVAKGKDYPVKIGVQLSEKAKNFFANYQF